MRRASLEVRQAQVRRLRPVALAVFALAAAGSAANFAFPGHGGHWLRVSSGVSCVLWLAAFVVVWRSARNVRR
jgi:hypothetical protein